MYEGLSDFIAVMIILNNFYITVPYFIAVDSVYLLIVVIMSADKSQGKKMRVFSLSCHCRGFFRCNNSECI